MSVYGNISEPKSMDWKDVSSSTTFPNIGTASKTPLSSRKSLLIRETPSRSLMGRTTTTSLPVEPAANYTQSEPSKYTSVLQKMRQLAGLGNDDPAGLRENDLQIAPLPKDVVIFLEKQRYKCTESLLESERNFVKTTAERNKESAMMEESEKFNFHTLQDLTVLSAGGTSEMLRKQQMRREELKMLTKMDHNHVVGDRTMTDQEAAFSRTLRECNEAILCSQEINMTQKFTDLVNASGNSQAYQLWQAFSAMITDDVTKSSGSSAHKSVVSLRSSRTFQEGILSRARKYLERTALESILNRSGLSILSANHREIVQFCAKMHLTRQKFAGIPGGSAGEVSIWAAVYYSLRLGLLKTALELVEKAGEGLGDLRRFLGEYERGDGWLPDVMRVEVEKVYRRLGNEDLYRKAVFAVLSRAETNETFPGVAVTVSDWLWLKLCQVTLPGKGFTMAKLQDAVREKFDSASPDDLECFLILTLTGQFEAAVEKLFENTKHRVQAAHMAICLKQIGILLSSEANSESPLHDLDFIALIKTYVREFSRQNPEAAVEYYFHLLSFPVPGTDFYDHNFRNMTELCLYKLARDTRAVGGIFGVVEGEGPGERRVKRGLVHKFMADPEELMVAVAMDLEVEGRVEEALGLLEVVGERGRLLGALVRGLARVLVLPVGDERRRAVVTVALACAKRLSPVDPAQTDTLLRNVYLLLDLMTFFDAFDRKQYRQAITIMKQLRVVSLEADHVLPAFDNYQRNLLTDVRRCVPDIILCTMRALVQTFMTDKESSRGSRVLARSSVEFLATGIVGSNVSLVDNLQEVQKRFTFQCRPLLEFAGMIPSPQLPNMMEILAQLEQSITTL